MSKVSFFKSITEIVPFNNLNIITSLDRIKKGKSKEIVLQIRDLRIKENKEIVKDDIEGAKEIHNQRDKLKKKLPYTTFNGTFNSRSKNQLIKGSGFAILDFDKIPILDNAEKILIKDKYTYSYWISPAVTV